MKRYWITLVTALAVIIQATVYWLVHQTLRRNTAVTHNDGTGFIVAEVDGGTQINSLHLPPSQAFDLPLEQQAALAAREGSLRSTSLLKPPGGAKVAIVDFEDLQCPWDARANPMVQSAASNYNVPLLRRDLSATSHVPWSFDAAVTARYLQDNVSPAFAEAFRSDVFANQNQIATQQDLANFTRGWFHSHGLPQPSATDASRKKVAADRALADRIGVDHTPSIFVVTQTKQVALTDVKQLDQTIHSALDQTATPRH